MLEKGSARHDRRAVPIGQPCYRIAQPLQLRFDKIEPPSHLQDNARIHGVLTGGTPMDEAAGRTGRLRERLHDRHGQRTGVGRGPAQSNRVVAVGIAGGSDGVGRLGRDQPEFRLCRGKRPLEGEHSFQGRARSEKTARIASVVKKGDSQSESVAERPPIVDALSAGMSGRR